MYYDRDFIFHQTLYPIQQGTVRFGEDGTKGVVWYKKPTEQNILKGT